MNVAYRVVEFCVQRADRTGDRSYGHRHISTHSSSLSCGTTQRYQPPGRFGILLRFRCYGSLTRMRWTYPVGCSDRSLLGQEIPRGPYIERISVLTSVLSHQVRTIWAVRKTVTVSGSSDRCARWETTTGAIDPKGSKDRQKIHQVRFTNRIVDLRVVLQRNVFVHGVYFARESIGGQRVATPRTNHPGRRRKKLLRLGFPLQRSTCLWRYIDRCQSRRK